MALYLGWRQDGFKWAQLAGVIDYAAVMAVGCFAGRMPTDKALARIMQKTEQELTNVAY